LSFTFNETQTKIRDVILKLVPMEAEISRIEYEGPKVAIYAKRPEVLVDQSFIITNIVGQLRKRIVIRSDPSVRAPERETEQVIRKIVSPEAEVTNTTFDPTVGEVVIEAKKPGLIIGKDGASLQAILKTTKWRPQVLRSPPIPSKIIAHIRHYLYSESAERGRVFRAIGERIFRPQVFKAETVTLTTLGGFREVGRSAILVQTKETSILLDCGLNPGSTDPARAYPRLSIDALDLERLDAVVISHAHLDHCGFLPFLYKYGYDGPVYCSQPTASLMTLLQLDYLDVTRKEGKSLPYDQKDIRSTILHTVPIKEETVTDIAPDVRLTIHNAGHILGSSITHLHFGEGLHNVVYTGDFKYGPSMLLEPAVTTFPRVETLIIESTYGAKDDVMPLRGDSENRLVGIANATLERGGKVLIPVPAVGRAQEILLVLDTYMRKGLLREAPIYIEGMVNEATAIHTAYPEHLARNVRDLILHQGINPFQSDYFVNVLDPSVRGEILEGGSSIVLATSGMLEGGPVLEYLKALASDDRNTIVFVSYQIEGTLGHRIQKSLKETPLINRDGKVEVVKIGLNVESVTGFSGHSDRNQILAYLKRISSKPEKVIIGHGEKSKCISMKNFLRRSFGMETYAPAVMETIRLK
jgi:KH/beta-lactamase-domain protein